MKRTGLLLILALTAVMFLPVSARDNSINVIGTVGVATGFDEPTVDIGVELEFSTGIFLQFMVNTHFGDSNPFYNDHYYGSSYYRTSNRYYESYSIVDLGNTLYGLNLYGVGKLKLSERLKVFGKAGVNITFYASQFVYDYIEPEDEKNGFGFGLGGGLQYKLTDKLSITVGGVYKQLFEKELYYYQGEATPALSERISWTKFFGGLSYKLN
ncbi:MAG: outer membrane beta-barrel protein [bacterium]|nr:outer membrane beta-barrel protein [bacterium]